MDTPPAAARPGSTAHVQEVRAYWAQYARGPGLPPSGHPELAPEPALICALIDELLAAQASIGDLVRYVADGAAEVAQATARYDQTERAAARHLLARIEAGEFTFDHAGA